MHLFSRTNPPNQYTSKDVMGRDLVREFITPEYQEAVQRVLDEALKGNETANFEFPLMTKAHVRVEVLLNASTRRNEQGEAIGVVGIGQDVTGRIAQEREYSNLIDTANAPIFGVDVDGKVNVWNQCAERIVGGCLEASCSIAAVDPRNSSRAPTRPTSTPRRT